MKMRRIAVFFGVVMLAAASAWALRDFALPFLCEDPLPLIEKHFADGGAYTDRHGRILRVFPATSGDFSVYSPLASHSAELVTAILTAEDRNFFRHPGFDTPAILRALWQNLTSNRIVSGASTISQQLIRVVRPRPRNLATKISELLLALRLEGTLSKNQILEKYLNAVSMFGNVRGINMAATLLFGKTVEMLNLGESATLAAAVQAPGRFNPFNAEGNKRLLRRRNWVLNEMLRAGKCSLQQYKNAVNENIPTWQRHRPFNAPHFCDLAVAIHGAPHGTIKTTIDMTLQNLLSSTLSSHLPRLLKRGALQAGGMIVDSRTLEILAMAGSMQYGPLAGGFNNVCVARRSGGSILKPFLYALALEKGYSPSFVIPDTMQTFKTPQGEYHPYNADRKSYGPVTIRTALGNSLNVSAVKMLNMLGIRGFYRLLVDLELLPDRPGAEDFFGLGLAIGNPEIRMLDLVKAYAVLVNGGSYKSLKFFEAQQQRNSDIISAQTAYQVFDILADPSARLFTFGNPTFFKTLRPIAIKTGTSTEYRDCWLLAVNSRFVIALWVGNFSGAPTRSLSGSTACGPIYKNLLDYLEANYQIEAPKQPAGLRRLAVCSISGQLPGKFCQHVGFDYFAPGSFIPEICTFHKSAGDSHDLPADYASWLSQRRKYLSIDPFRLADAGKVADPWVLRGLTPAEPVIAIASGPMRVESFQQAGSQTGIKIVSPHDGDRYVMSSSRENFALLRAIPSQPVPEVIWLIDGSEFLRTPPPYEAYWPLSQGTHRISALTDSDVAAEIEIQVEY
ncbi:MAG: transglycosylase domain-containing protein [Candidatus Riflebacteria bacterium]|nr:transglycosylase domain-containing protein [Candidatus Riflebacteria bacterium]